MFCWGILELRTLDTRLFLFQLPRSLSRRRPSEQRTPTFDSLSKECHSAGFVKGIKGVWLVPADCPNFELFAVSLKNPSSIPAASYLEVLWEESTRWAVPFRAPKELAESASFQQPS
jgi:hypothetical protein